MYSDSEDSFGRSASSLSNDSFVSSDEEGFGDVAATSLDMHKAYFSTAPYGDDSVFPEGRKFLRKNEAAYDNRPATENVLPHHFMNSNWSDVRDQHGLATDDREVVGYYVDEKGTRVAEIVESLPPPPDKNYSHMHASGRHHLARALGYDPHVYHRKVETEGVTNPADPINGDAQLSATRIEEGKEFQERSLFFNRSHVHDVPEMETSREGYDGLNPSRSAPERVRASLEHSWREAQPPPQAPSLAQLTRGGDDPVRGTHSTRRKEVGKTFSRVNGAARAVVRLDSVMDIPVASDPLRRDDVAESRTSGPSTTDAQTPAPRGGSDAPEGMRQKEHSPPGVARGDTEHPPLHASAQREGGEDEELVRIMSSHGAPVSAASSHASVPQREGGQERVSKHLSQSSVGVHAPKLAGKQLLSGQDVVPVREERPHASSGAAIPSAPSKHVTKVDRLVLDPDTAWVFGNGASSMRQGAVMSGHDGLQEDRTCEVDRAASGASGQEQKSRRTAAPLRATAGAKFVPDRLAQANEEDWRMREKLVCPTQQNGIDRSTPTRAMLGEPPPSMQRASAADTYRLSSRGTPATYPVRPSSAALRG